MTLGGIAGLIAALAFLYLVLRLGGLLGKAGQILDETTVSLRTTSDNVQPTLKGLTDTVSLTNDQLTRVDSITSSVTTMTTNASALTSLTAATIGTPLIKVAAFSYGVRTAVRGLAARTRREGPHRAAGRRGVGVGYALWKLPVTQRFVSTVKDASARREAELREAVEVAVETDATSRAPRHAAWAETPDLEVDAGWNRDRARGAAAPASALGADDPGRSLTPEQARALLLDPTGERAP